MHRAFVKAANLRPNHLSCPPPGRPPFLQSSATQATHETPSSSFRSWSCRMSSTVNATKNGYLVIVPDHANSLPKRLAVRAKHLENITPHVQSGDVVFGGSTLYEHPKEGEQPDMTGSAILIKAESETAVREWIAGDVYAKSGVWNVDQATIYPFRSAVRTAM